MAKEKRRAKVVYLKGNGPIIINSEMMELITITLAHGLVGLPLKSLKAELVYLVDDMERYWEIHKEIKDKPACFVYAPEALDEEDLARIDAQRIERV